MTEAKGVIPNRESPAATYGRTFLNYLDNAIAHQTHDATGRDRMKRWLWESVKLGYRPCLLPDTTYTREDVIDAD